MAQLSENSLRVLESRYLQRDKSGNIIEKPDEFFRRVASAVARAELFWSNANDAKMWKEKFYNLMSALLFLPNSPTGTSACISEIYG